MNILQEIKNLFKKKDKLEELREKDILEWEETMEFQTEKVYTEKIKTSDMLQFKDIKYNLNCEIETRQNAYMMLNEYNQNIAKQDFELINKIIRENFNLSSKIKHDLQIPINEIIYQQYGQDLGYSKLICTPYTPTGKISKYPIYLFFTTRNKEIDCEMETINNGQTIRAIPTYTDGYLYYTKNGNIGKADIIFWRKGIFYAYRFKSDKDNLYINKIEKSDKGEIEKKVIFSRK